MRRPRVPVSRAESVPSRRSATISRSTSSRAWASSGCARIARTRDRLRLVISGAPWRSDRTGGTGYAEEARARDPHRGAEPHRGGDEHVSARLLPGDGSTWQRVTAAVQGPPVARGRSWGGPRATCTLRAGLRVADGVGWGCV